MAPNVSWIAGCRCLSRILPPTRRCFRAMSQNSSKRPGRGVNTGSCPMHLILPQRMPRRGQPNSGQAHVVGTSGAVRRLAFFGALAGSYEDASCEEVADRILSLTPGSVKHSSTCSLTALVVG